MIKSKYGMLDFDSAIEMLKKGMVGKVMTKDFDQLDEKIGLILDLQSGNPLKIFPRKIDPLIVWETPSTVFKGGMQEFVRSPERLPPLRPLWRIRPSGSVI